MLNVHWVTAIKPWSRKGGQQSYETIDFIVNSSGAEARTFWKYFVDYMPVDDQGGVSKTLMSS